MGVYIFMDILPNEIDPDEWEDVYEESLQLIDAYPFLDNTVDTETHGVIWRYGHRAKELEMDFDHDYRRQLGWHVFGDYPSMQSAESFSLFRNLACYRKKARGNDGHNDILVKSIEQEGTEIPVNNVTVFGNKTQGFPFHIYLLAIACLIESRFPKHAMVKGDISIAQMQKAIDWANSILNKPIQLTERANNEKLLLRIKAILPDDNEAALETFMSMTMHGEDVHLGDVIRKHFQPETIRFYFLKGFKHYNIEQIGFKMELSRFLNLGFSIEDACDICVLDDDGCRYDPKVFAEAILTMEWGADESSNEIPLTFNDPDDEEPETVDAQFGKTFLRAAGFQERMKSNLSYEDVSAILQKKLGDRIDIAPVLKESRIEQNENDDELDELLSRFRKGSGTVHDDKTRYTIENLEDLLQWREGDSVHPAIEEGLKRLKDFVTEDLENNKMKYDRFHDHADDAKIRMLINANEYFLIRDETWQHLFNHLDHTHLMNTVIGIMSIKADEVTINKYCKALMNNMNLLNRYML
ncbi:hypothetical protein HUG15_04405 [Salicibibacter cibarius]|uniref:Uncharacterized protein n=1 Tax=Salicibibacter cibarius TaxID=2743000 RepID=A0A7T6Z173_9BACI|nr:hypothetical protein [Salicibibacter cibarius]QQK74918.1 hypothetical protein HUG15_04405 [Salicibibacter cibarius]